jgi:8-oxo-dGTP pyrophosphatase MutT (NUDIX family)
MPIISIGIIAFTVDAMGEYKFLMIRRKDTLGFMDFMRGKYSIYNKEYIINLLNEMTVSERNSLLEKDFQSLWVDLWCDTASSYKSEECVSNDKFNALSSGIMTSTDTYTLHELANESSTQWEEAEWGFPKGRRNYNEKDLDCALREFTEETGYDSKFLKNIENLQQYDEIFMGSNHKSYKHKYYLMRLDADNTERKQFDKSEVSKVEWKTYTEALACIRPYNLEKIRVIQDVYKCLTTYKLTI